ncbi:hypothetical protein ACS3SW_20825 [Roseobacteraceae bacterium S113]
MSAIKALSSIVGLQILGALTSLCAILILTATLGIEGYGRYVWIVAMGEVAGLILQRGLPTTIVKTYAPLHLGTMRYPSPLSNTYALYLLAALVSAGVAAVTGGIFGGLLWVAPIALSLASLALADAILRSADQGLRAQVAIQIIRAGGFLIGVGALSWWGQAPPIAYLALYTSAAWAAAAIFTWPLLAGALRHRMRGGMLAMNSAHFQVVLSRSVGDHLPVFITGFFVPPATLAYLAIAIRLTGPTTFGGLAARAYYGATINKHIKQGNLAKVRELTSVALQFAVVLAGLAAGGVLGLVGLLLFWGQGPLESFDNVSLLISLFGVIILYRLLQSSYGITQFVAILLGAERFIRDVNILALAGFSLGLVGAAMAGDVRLSTGVMVLYGLALTLAIYRKMRMLLPGDS